MCLRRQFLERHLGVFHRIALRTESGIPQAWATVFIGRAIAKAAATVTASIIARAATTRISATTITALTGTCTTTRNCGCVFFHARAVISTHSNHWPRRLGRRYRGSRRSSSIFTARRLGCGKRFIARNCRLVTAIAIATTVRCSCAVGLRHGGSGTLLVLMSRSCSLCSLGLTAQRSLQALHSSADLLCIARRIRGFESFGRVKHHTITRAQFCHCLFSVSGLAVESFIDRLAK